jgi:hypothetical protein
MQKGVGHYSIYSVYHDVFFFHEGFWTHFHAGRVNCALVGCQGRIDNPSAKIGFLGG